MTEHQTTVCSLRVFSRATLPVAGAVVDEAVRGLGVTADDSVGLRVITRELAQVVVDSGFGEAATADIDVSVSVERRPGGIAVVVKDLGAPTTLTTEDTRPPRLSDLVRLGFADELSFARHGRDGNVAELVKRLTYRHVADDRDFEDEATATSPTAPVSPTFEFRPLVAADTLEVARLFYRCYGYSAYQIGVVYEPELLAELILAGRHRATVALSDGAIVGHIASTVDRPDATVGLVGMLVVDPAFRSFKLAAHLTFHHFVRMVSEGFIGQYSSCVTAHPASQKIALKFDGHEVALLLAEQQPSLLFKDIDDPDGEPNALRRATVWFFNSVGEQVRRTVHVPPAYRDIVREIYDTTGLPREIAPATTRAPDTAPETCELSLVLKNEANVAVVTVVSYGKDFVRAVQDQLTELRLNRVDVIRLVLPAGDSLTSYYGSGLTELGFFFCGVNPEIADGDTVVLQCLNNVEVDPERILLAGDFGVRLREFVLADRARATDTAADRVRSRAHMARIYDALR